MTSAKSPGAGRAHGASEKDELGQHVVSSINRQQQFPQGVIRATLFGSDLCEADGISARGYAPVLDLCRALVAAGFNAVLSRGLPSRMMGTGRHTFAASARVRRRRRRTRPRYAAASSLHGDGNHIQSRPRAQLDLFDGAAMSTDPLCGLTVKLPDTCSNCGDLVTIVGPGKPPHAASLLCRACGLHRGWISRANHTFLNEIINKFGAPTEPIVFRNRSTRPEQNDERVSVLQVAIKPGGENGNTI
jgi:hypothetical protein